MSYIALIDKLFAMTPFRCAIEAAEKLIRSNVGRCRLTIMVSRIIRSEERARELASPLVPREEAKLVHDELYQPISARIIIVRSPSDTVRAFTRRK